MLSAVAMIVVIGWTTLFAMGLASLVDVLERRRRRRIAAQVRVTDAVHAALGPIVAPTVAKHPGTPWTVRVGLAPGDLRVAGRVTEIACDALGQGNCVRIVFVPRIGAASR